MTPVSPELIALLAVCRARPADDLPRLVLADWLDENGQPERAEFVRIQVEVSHPTADVERIRGLKKREAELLAEYETEWCGEYDRQMQRMLPKQRPIDYYREYGRHMPQPPARRFVRGMVRVADATQYIDRPELRDWLKSPELPWVEQIDFSFSSTDWFVKSDLPDELHGRIGLSLRIGGPSDPSAWRGWFHQLAVSGNFTAVRSLDVTGADGVVVLEELTSSDVSNLVALVAHTPDGARAASLVGSAPFSALSTLNVGPISEVGLRALIASPHLGNLTHLNLVGSPIGDAGLVALCRSGLARSLRRVEFPNTGIGDQGVKALVSSPLFAHMHGPRLNLNMNRIGDAGLKELAKSEHLLRFREIAFRSGEETPHQQNQIGDEGVEALAASPYAANVQFLDFWRNRITDRGAFALARSPHLNKVVDLSVKENAVSPAGAAALHERFGEGAKV